MDRRRFWQDRTLLKEGKERSVPCTKAVLTLGEFYSWYTEQMMSSHFCQPASYKLKKILFVQSAISSIYLKITEEDNQTNCHMAKYLFNIIRTKPQTRLKIYKKTPRCHLNFKSQISTLSYEKFGTLHRCTNFSNFLIFWHASCLCSLSSVWENDMTNL